MWDRAIELDAFVGDLTGVKVEWRYSQIKSDEWTSKDVSILRTYEWDRINFATAKQRRNLAKIWGLSEEELEKIRKETRDTISFD
jgi:hypothetical protein